MKEISFADYFASGAFDEDLSYDFARADLIEASDLIQRYFRRRTNKTNAERLRLENKLYNAAKKFIETRDAAIRRFSEKTND